MSRLCFISVWLASTYASLNLHPHLHLTSIQFALNIHLLTCIFGISISYEGMIKLFWISDISEGCLTLEQRSCFIRSHAFNVVEDNNDKTTVAIQQLQIGLKRRRLEQRLRRKVPSRIYSQCTFNSLLVGEFPIGLRFYPIIGRPPSGLSRCILPWITPDIQM